MINTKQLIERRALLIQLLETTDSRLVWELAFEAYLAVCDALDQQASTRPRRQHEPLLEELRE
jgi:hypothetical protein